jgi:mannose-6-phosphate isomerase-like protein (cupin superfamily)
MQATDLPSLDRAASRLLDSDDTRRIIERLRGEIGQSIEPFVWASLDLERVRDVLPAHIQSAWIFVLREGVWSGAHYHPNSVQHMIVVEGRGRSRIAGEERVMTGFGDARRTAEQRWQVIPARVPHEFLPEGSDMVVISFHTCAAHELEEFDVGTGRSRLYEPRG